MSEPLTRTILCTELQRIREMTGEIQDDAGLDVQASRVVDALFTLQMRVANAKKAIK